MRVERRADHAPASATLFAPFHCLPSRPELLSRAYFLARLGRGLSAGARSALALALPDTAVDLKILSIAALSLPRIMHAILTAPT